MKPKAQLLAVLAEVGVTPEDYGDVQRARRLVDQVNARLAARGAAVLYAITMCSAQGARTTWPSEITES